MYWIALSPPPEGERLAWTWWALRFTPRVALVEEAILLEVSASLRLFGGRRGLLQLLLKSRTDLQPPPWAAGPTALVALALLRCKLRSQAAPAPVPDGLPLELLSAALPHVPLLERTGIRSWGQLRALPRGGLSRRFGAGLLAALDAAYGQRPEQYPWETLPEAFDLDLELDCLATGTHELMPAAEHLLRLLQHWLQARNRGVLALELEWTLDLRRLNGVRLPPREQLQVRTAQPTQEMAHLRRLVGEHLARARLSAPANHLRLRSLETVPWGGATASLLPQEQAEGERLHQLVERLSVRLGDDSVLVPQAQQDHRPECKQDWRPARAHEATPCADSDALYPTWLLPQPLKLRMQGETPCFGGPLRRLARLYRVETAWWEEPGPALRDYFIARSPQAGLVWIYRERPRRLAQELATSGPFAWYLQGLYA
ncbi:DNA polymerase Y family protein [Ramlibacter tataouinensis]|uniref:DNA polymerase Y family protein n=1 Tax=Ramlibacter tataouinensis TaxID=94132 RepID=UPI0022F3F228|nr:DNA polymerase Y family protein [Ramlibacter tataouinensis]WBY01505.1 DNA polymerase Y family protein [Ramlibacter tataouinensis]